MNTDTPRIEDILNNLPPELRGEITETYGDTLVQENFIELGSITSSNESSLVNSAAPLNLAEELLEESPENEVVANIVETNECNFPSMDNIVETTYETTKVNALFTGVNEETLRFNGAEWFENVSSASVTLLGAGGISSWVGILLGKLGIFYLDIYDPDDYEAVNIAGQFCFRRDKGSNKAAALGNTIRDTGSCTFINHYSLAWTNRRRLQVITIVGVDNMTTRLEAFHSWVEQWGNTPNALFIDGRLAAEMYQLYTIKGGDTVAQQRYAAEWFSDEDADELICSFKQTAFMGAALGAKIIEHLVNFLTPIEAAPRLVPFYIEHTPYKDTIIKFAYNE